MFCFQCNIPSDHREAVSELGISMQRLHLMLYLLFSPLVNYLLLIPHRCTLIRT